MRARHVVSRAVVMVGLVAAPLAWGPVGIVDGKAGQATARLVCATTPNLRLALQRVTGSAGSLAEAIEGPTFVVFFGSYAPTAREQLGIFLGEEGKRRTAKATVVGVSAEGLTETRRFVESRKIPWAVFSAEEATLLSWEIRTLPETWLLNENGALCNRFRQVATAEVLGEALDKLVR